MRLKTGLRLVVVAALAACLVQASTVLAKGTVEMISVSGPGLNEPVEITDRNSLEPFLPWSRDFIDWGRGIISDPAPGLRNYEVQFYLDRGESPIYVVEYSPEPHGGPGYVYIPPSDLNLGTILTGDSDYWDPNGKWHHATRAWGLLMQKALEGRPNAGQTDGSRIDRVTLAGPGLAGTIDVGDTTPLAQFVLGNGRMVDWQWGGNVNYGDGITVPFLTDRPQPDETYEVVSHVRRGDGSPEVHEMLYYQHPSGWGYILRDDLALDPSGGGTWVKATGDLNRALERVIQESTGSLASGSQSIAEEVGQENASPSAASPDGGSSVRWLLALPAMALTAGAAWLLWLGLRSRARRPTA